MVIIFAGEWHEELRRRRSGALRAPVTRKSRGRPGTVGSSLSESCTSSAMQMGRLA